MFHGRLPKDVLHEMLRGSCVSVMPSRWYENQPLAVLESMANGVPVVATDLGGTPELIRPGVDGELVPADDPEAMAQALSGFLDNPDKAFLMGQAGRERIEAEFTPADHLAGLDRLYADGGRPPLNQRAGQPWPISRRRASPQSASGSGRPRSR